jgi:hypothetical protein
MSTIKKNLIEAMDSFSLSKKILTEDYGMMQGYPSGQPEDGSEFHSMEGGMNPDEEQENRDMDLSKTDERIASIREIALDGLQDYAHDVDCEAYQFYKKIWLMCDKAVSEKESASGGGGMS